MTLDVKTRIDPEWVLAPAGVTFAVVPIRQGTPDELQEKELLHYLRQRLVLKGLTYDERAPQLIVGMNAYIGPFEEYVPPSTFYWPVSSTSRTTTTTNTGVTATSVTDGPTQYVPIHKPGYTRLHYFRSVSIFIGKPRPDASGISPVWQATVESSGDISDFLEVAPTMIRHALTEFPRKSGASSRREVQLIRAEDP